MSSKIVSLEEQLAKKKNTFVSEFLRKHGKKYIGEILFFKPDELQRVIENRSNITTSTGLGDIDILLYYLIKNIDDWGKDKIKTEIEDLRYEIQSMRNTERKFNHEEKKRLKRFVAAYNLAKGTEKLLRFDGMLPESLHLITCKFSQKLNEDIDEYLLQFTDMEQTENDSLLMMFKQIEKVMK